MEIAERMENNPQPAVKSEQTKNPKRVAAGHKAAERRRAKQFEVEERLAQLEELKQSMHEEASKRQEPQSERVTAVTSEVAKKPFNWTPWVVVGLILAAIA